MKETTSLYLDFLRFFAAVLVLIVHSYGMGMTGGFLWFLGTYGQTAVMLFFVLSGYVIAFVSDSREKSLRDYAFARVSRIYSVVGPALLLTLLANTIGSHFIRADYSGPWDSGDDPMRYILTFLMVQDAWGLGRTPINNGPFWSISFEVAYYALFAVLHYARSGPTKYVALFALALIAGPTIMILFPIWLLGYLAYHVHRGQLLSISRNMAILIFLLSAIALAASPSFREIYSMRLGIIQRDSILGDYYDGIACFLHLLVVPVVAGAISPVLLAARKPIVFCASLTFSLYLFHLPLVRMFAGVSPFISDPGSTINRLFVYGCTFAVVVMIGVPCERLKRPLNHFLRRLVSVTTDKSAQAR